MDQDQVKQSLAEQYGEVWSTDEMLALFEVLGFSYGVVVVQRRSDGIEGTLAFDHSPRFYYNFVASVSVRI